MKKPDFGIVCLTLGFAITALAQNADPPRSDAGGGKAAAGQFSAVDTNRDGRISQVEARAYGNLGSSFPALDVDKDSYLSRSEFGKWNAGPNNPAVSPTDSNRVPLGGDAPGDGAARPGDGTPQSQAGNSAPRASDESTPNGANPHGADSVSSPSEAK